MGELAELRRASILVGLEQMQFVEALELRLDLAHRQIEAQLFLVRRVQVLGRLDLQRQTGQQLAQFLQALRNLVMGALGMLRREALNGQSQARPCQHGGGTYLCAFKPGLEFSRGCREFIRGQRHDLLAQRTVEHIELLRPQQGLQVRIKIVGQGRQFTLQLLTLGLGRLHVATDGVNAAAARVLHQRRLLLQATAFISQGPVQQGPVGNQRKLRLQIILALLCIQHPLTPVHGVKLKFIQLAIIELQVGLLRFNFGNRAAQSGSALLVMRLPLL